MGHISDAPSGQGLPLRTSIGTYSWASGRLLLTFALVILLGRLAVQSHVTLGLPPEIWSSGYDSSRQPDPGRERWASGRGPTRSSGCWRRRIETWPGDSRW